MRILLLALMIALLPVRGWVGNAMALDAAVHPASAVQVEPGQPLASMPEDCPMHAQVADNADSAGCQGCDTCQLCLALASLSWSASAHAPSLPHAAPTVSGSRFSSADRLPGVKPPIS
jgi:hypothetical protein